jgi:hypothetical protein
MVPPEIVGIESRDDYSISSPIGQMKKKYLFIERNILSLYDPRRAR